MHDTGVYERSKGVGTKRPRKSSDCMPLLATVASLQELAINSNRIQALRCVATKAGPKPSVDLTVFYAGTPAHNRACPHPRTPCAQGGAPPTPPPPRLSQQTDSQRATQDALAARSRRGPCANMSHWRLPRSAEHRYTNGSSREGLTSALPRPAPDACTPVCSVCTPEAFQGTPPLNPAKPGETNNLCLTRGRKTSMGKRAQRNIPNQFEWQRCLACTRDPNTQYQVNLVLEGSCHELQVRWMASAGPYRAQPICDSP